MSITLRTEINITARIVLSTETVAEMEGERAKLRSMIAQEPAKYEALSGDRKRLVDLMTSDRNTEELFKVLFRAGFRDYSKDGLAKELSAEGLKFDRVQAKVSFNE